MGNCFGKCGLNDYFPQDSNPIIKDQDWAPCLDDFQKLQILGHGALGTVFLVEMKKTS